MPAPSTLALFALAALALIAIPGPNMVYVATRSMSEGRRAGYRVRARAADRHAINVAAAAAGLSALIASSATAFNALRYLGAAYLVYLGIRALLTRGEAAQDGAAAAGLAGPRLPPGDRRPVAQPEGRAVLPRVPAAVRRPRARPGRRPRCSCWARSSARSASRWTAVTRSRRVRRRRLGGFRHGSRVTGAVYIALGAAAALTGGRR